MTQPQDPAAEAPEIIGPPAPGRRTVTLEFDLDRLPSTATALGISLVGAAIVMGAGYARAHHGLDGSNFTVGVLAVIGLLVVSAVAQLAMPELDRRAALVSWPGAFGAVGAGLLLAVLLDSQRASIYFGSGLTLALSAAGYLLTRGGPFVVGSIATLALAYGQVCSDVLDFGNGNDALMIVGAAVLFFIVLVTALGWLLPETRVLSAMVVGVGGLWVMTTAVGPIFAFGLAFSRASADFGGGPAGPPAPQHNPFENDIWMLLFYSFVLAVLWSACSLATGFVGFRVLIAVLAVIVVPLASVGLAVSHPTWWEVVLSAAGGALLVAAGVRSVSSRP